MKNDSSKAINKNSKSTNISQGTTNKEESSQITSKDSKKCEEHAFFRKDSTKTKTNNLKLESQINGITNKTIKSEEPVEEKYLNSNFKESKTNHSNSVLNNFELNQSEDVRLINVDPKSMGKKVSEISIEKTSNLNGLNNVTNNNLSIDFKELNLLNNLNSKLNKNNDKDISKLISPNVEVEEPFSKPGTSELEKSKTNLEKLSCENSSDKTQAFKKHNDKKYFKKSHSKDNKSHKHGDWQSQKTKNTDKSSTRFKDSVKQNKLGDTLVKTNTTPKKDISKKKLISLKKDRYRINLHDSDYSSSSDEVDNINRCSFANSNQIKTNKKHSGCTCIEGKVNEEKCSNSSKINKFSENQTSTKTALNKKVNKEERKKSLNEKASEVEIPSEDDSDNDIPLNQYLKLTSTLNNDTLKQTSDEIVIKKEIKENATVSSNEAKSVKAIKKENEVALPKEINSIKKESDKGSPKSKKDSSAKHKKDKDSKNKNHDKSFKKEEKLSKKDSEKSLAKLLKKEKDSLKYKKEEKSKHKKDGSYSSKSSKRDFDKDGSKLKKESEKDNFSLEKHFDKKVEFSESKKDKISKKELSKISRSNSCDETKSPKKKKKFNELKSIEKIKNLISNSTILNEISGFKSFKRRLSGDKSDLKKRLSKKKQKKLALLKEKKLSKKLSSKLLRKYSKKKGLKSKKNKLKKKELKVSSVSKIHSKNKKQKHKLKEHHRRISQEKTKGLDATISNKVDTSWIPNSLSILETLDNQHPQTSLTLNNDIMHTFKNDKGTSVNFAADNMVEIISPLKSSTDIFKPVSTDLIYNSCEELSGIVTAGVSEEGSATILLTTQDSMSQVPVHFVQDIPIVKTVADAATNTCDEDIDEVINAIAEHEMSVGTQTMTPTGSPSPTFEMRSLLSAEPSVLNKDLKPTQSNLVSRIQDKNISSTASNTFKEISLAKTMNVNLPCTVTGVNLTKSSEKVLPAQELADLSTSGKKPNENVFLSGTATLSSRRLSLRETDTPLPASITCKRLSLGNINVPVSSKCISNANLNVPSPAATSSKSFPFNDSGARSTSLNSSVNTVDLKKVPTKDTSVSQAPIKNASTPLPKNLSLTPKKKPSVSKPEPSSDSKIKKRTPSIKKTKISKIVTSCKADSFPLDTAKMVSAPVYYPTVEEFQDPLDYISKIYPEAEQFGICKIVPPASFKPECKVNDDLRFMALNQYLHKMLYRWGPNVQHTACIKKHLKSQKVKLEQAPLIGGIELDISKFYHTVQQFGGLQQVIEKKKWHKVADAMHVPKAAQDRVTKLYDAYCKYLVSYDTLPFEEKQKLEEEVIADHNKYVVSRNSKDSDKDEELEDEESPECVTKGRSMPLSNFFRIARNTMSMWFKNDHPLPEEVEHEFWKIVTERNQHIVVHAGNIDSNTSQSGFPVNRSPLGKHPWNLKVLTNNNRSILRCMGPVSGITSPTLHVGMLFTTSCWYRDPHSLPWIEYLHTGASKIWYGIPANGSEKFKSAMKKIVPEYCIDKPLWLSSESSMIPPDLLVKHGSSLSRTIQKNGQFVVIFPESFTSTICCGYCVSESVYFAPTLWLDLAEKAFQDIHKSCESPAFSLERLFFSISNDPKLQLKAYQKVLPMIENIKSKELNLRIQLKDLGLKELERHPLSEPQDKKKKSKGVIDESEPECEICSAPCYLSWVYYSQEDSVYCLSHALEHVQKKNFKFCKLMYTFDEKDFSDAVKRIQEFISQLPDDSAKKKTFKKKILAPEKGN